MSDGTAIPQSPAATTSVPITINLDDLLQIVAMGVRRAAVFMGLGLNACADPNFRNYKLAKIAGMEFVPHQVSDETLRGFKEEFANWVTANGFRELVESMELFLNRVYSSALCIDRISNGVQVDVVQKRLKRFCHDGVSKKLERLAGEYAIATVKEPALDSIHLLRNCLTHRRGLVAAEDGDPALVVCWWGFDIVLETKNGVRTVLPNPIGDAGFRVVDDSQAFASYVERSKSFPIGTVVRLSSRDVAEMCQMMLMAAQDILKSFLAYGQSKGIALTQTLPNEGRTTAPP